VGGGDTPAARCGVVGARTLLSMRISQAFFAMEGRKVLADGDKTAGLTSCGAESQRLRAGSDRRREGRWRKSSLGMAEFIVYVRAVSGETL
jgi:hypothetical protein